MGCEGWYRADRRTLSTGVVARRSRVVTVELTDILIGGGQVGTLSRGFLTWPRNGYLPFKTYSFEILSEHGCHCRHAILGFVFMKQVPSYVLLTPRVTRFATNMQNDSSYAGHYIMKIDV